MEKDYTKIKNTVMVVTAIITILAIFYGMYAHILGGKNRLGDLGEMTSDTIYLDGEVDNISISLDVAKLVVNEGEKTSVRYEIPEKLVPQISLDAGELVVKNRGDFNFSSNANKAGNYIVEVTVAKGSSLKNVNIDVNLGEIKINDITTEKLCADADAGDLVISGVDIGRLEMDVDAGEAKCVDSTAKTIKVDVDMGSVVLTNMIFESAVCNADMGDIEVSGEFDKLSADCNMGDIRVETKKDEKDVALDLNIDMGNIKVNGKSWNE